MSLDLKYRPRAFGDVLGQDSTVKVLRSVLTSEEKCPPLLFYGGHGLGKTSLARIVANSLLCPSSILGDPCGTCDLCVRFRSCPDQVFTYQEMDAASEGSVKNARSLVEEAQFHPLGGERRVILIDECHMLTVAAQNALLKLLEDGSKNIVFLFCTTEQTKVLSTLLSRTLMFRVGDIPFSTIVKKLCEVCERESIPYLEEAMHLLVSHCKGHVRDCYKEITRLQYSGGVLPEVVRRVLELDTEVSYLQTIYYASTDGSKMMELLEALTQRSSIREIYRGLSRASLRVFKRHLGMPIGLPEGDAVWCDKLVDLLGDRSLRVSRLLTSKAYGNDLVTLECDLLTLHHFLKEGFPGEPKYSIVKKSSPSFNSRMEELEFYSQKSRSSEDRDLSFAETLDILNAYVVAD